MFENLFVNACNTTMQRPRGQTQKPCFYSLQLNGDYVLIHFYFCKKRKTSLMPSRFQFHHYSFHGFQNKLRTFPNIVSHLGGRDVKTVYN